MHFVMKRKKWVEFKKVQKPYFYKTRKLKFFEIVSWLPVCRIISIL